MMQVECTIVNPDRPPSIPLAPRKRASGGGGEMLAAPGRPGDGPRTLGAATVGPGHPPGDLGPALRLSPDRRRTMGG
jgi:hypothetical protein